MKKALASLLGFLCSASMVIAESGFNYVKVKTAPQTWDGEYLIVCESKDKAFNGSLETLDANNNYKSVTIENETIYVDKNTDIEKSQFTIASLESGYSIKSASNKFIGASGSSSLTTGNSAIQNDINLSNDGSEVIITSKNVKLRYNTSANRFRYYSSGQAAITLYKKVASAPDKRTPVNLTRFTAEETTLTKGDTTTTRVVNDKEGWTANYKYNTSDDKVATVDEDGVITAVGKGTATITVTAVFDNDKEYKAGGTTSLTVNITVVNPNHTVTFLANGQVVSSTLIEEGETITIPATLDAQLVPEDKTFMGWTDAAIDDTETAPTLVKSAKVGENDVTFYAVFATASASGNANWVKKTVKQVVDNPEAGDYALITPDGHAFNKEISSGHGQTTKDAFSFSNNEATSAPEGTCMLSISRKGDKGIEIAIKEGGKVITASQAGSGGFTLSDSKDAEYWFGDVNLKYNKKYSGNKYAYLRSLSNSSFRTYSNTSNGDTIAFAYKAGITYTDYCTTVGGNVNTREWVKFTNWATEGGVLTLVKGNTLATVTTLDPAACTSGSFTYESSNKEVATIDDNGVITAVAKGEATLTATFSLAEDDANYRLSGDGKKTINITVVNPEHTVTFAIDGVTDSKNVREEEAIHFPAVSTPAGLVFVGWTNKDIEGMVAAAPTLVDTTAVVMGESNLYFAAVFARVAQKGEIKQYELTEDMIQKHFDQPDNMTYNGAERSWNDGQVTWSAVAQTASPGDYLQIRNKESMSYIGIEAPLSITHISFSITNGSGKAEYDGEVYVKSEPTTRSNDGDVITSVKINEEETCDVTVPGNHTKIYLQTSGAARIKNIVLTCQDADRYLGYVTNSKDANTKRTVDVTIIANCGYTTVCLPYNAKAPEGAKFFALKSVDSEGLHFVSTDKLAAGQGYVLQGEAGAQYTLTEVTEAVDYNVNILKGVVEQTNLVDLGFTGKDDYNYPWILAKDGTFKRYTGAYIPAGKAYLDGALLQNLGESGAATMRVIFEEATNGQETGLSQLSDKSESNACYYNLQGQRIAQPTQAGVLYIEQSGRKLILRK